PPDTTPPTVTLTAPAAGATVSGTITVSAGAADNVGVAGGQVLVDGAGAGAEGTTPPYPLSYDTSAAGHGTPSLSAPPPPAPPPSSPRSADGAGTTTTPAAVAVTVANVECYTAIAGGGWVNDAFDASQAGSFTATFDARPSVANIDSVIGLSNGPQTTYPGF